MNRKQISQHYEVDPKTIDNWEREGMPVKRRPGINKGVYEVAKIDKWLEQRGSK